MIPKQIPQRKICGFCSNISLENVNKSVVHYFPTSGIWKLKDVSQTCTLSQNNYCFYKFYLCRRHSLMNLPCYNNLFQITQHDNFWNLNRMIFTHWKHLKIQIKTFNYLIKLVPIPRNQSSFETLQLFNTWCYQK